MEIGGSCHAKRSAAFSAGFSQTSQRNRVDCDRSWICRSEPGEGVLKYVEVGDQDKSRRWHEIRDCSRRAVRNRATGGQTPEKPLWNAAVVPGSQDLAGAGEIELAYHRIRQPAAELKDIRGRRTYSCVEYPCSIAGSAYRALSRR